MKSAAFRIVLFSALVAGSATASAAEGTITYLGLTGSDETPLLAVGSDRGMVFIGTDYQPYRAFAHTQTAGADVEQPFLWVEDVDNDGDDDFVGAGNPSFVITNEAEPLWGISGGCDQFFVGNFADDRSMEVACREGGNVRILSWDGQLYLSWEGSARTLQTCYADDFDGDGYDEIQCGLTNGNHVSFDLAYAEPEEVEQPVAEAPNTGVNTSALQAAAGTSGVDIGGQSIVLGYEAGAIRFGDTTVAIGSSGIYSAMVTDFDGDGTSELFVGGNDEVYVISPTGELLHTIPANPESFTRESRVTVRTATANGLVDSDRDSVRASVESSLNLVDSCYVNRMGSDRYTRTGEMLFELTVSESGSVTRATRRHSTLQNEGLEACVENELEDFTFSPASSGTGIVQVMLNFDFVDR
jgi:hypothetical protein